MVRLAASDFYTLHRPSKCELRVYLKHKGEKESPPGPYDEVLKKLGERHEQSHLEAFPEIIDLGHGTALDREVRTHEAIQARKPALYHALFRAQCNLGNIACEITGEPDFLILEQDGYVIRDSKISRRITESDHPEILRQLEIYGWLLHQVLGRPPVKLQVHSGPGAIVDVPYDDGKIALKVLQDILRIKQAASEPYSPVGWSKCTGCGFYNRCWSQAEEKQNVALLCGVDQGLVVALREQNVETVNDLLASFDECSLSEFKRPWGQGSQRVGKKAESILQMACCLASGKEKLLQAPDIPKHPNYVMFDLEGLPPQLDELDKIYLWGLQVFGKEGSKYLSALAKFGVDGDREGWNQFLGNAEAIFNQYGDIPFVHWHHYERVRLDAYIARYGDPSGIAARVKNNLLDLLPICQKSLALPLPSYSLKVIEKYIGFERTQDGYGGEWSMAKYIEATELKDVDERDKVMDEILTYNREDLEATWHVLQWLKSKG